MPRPCHRIQYGIGTWKTGDISNGRVYKSSLTQEVDMISHLFFRVSGDLRIAIDVTVWLFYGPNKYLTGKIHVTIHTATPE
jgi:hypothetical protein